MKRRGKSGALIRYARRPETETAEEKLSFLGSAGSFSSVSTDAIVPDQRHDWLDQASSSGQQFLPLVDPNTKMDARSTSTRAIFKLVSNGLKTQRDEWAYDRNPTVLERKVRFLLHAYERTRTAPQGLDRRTIKWDAELARYLSAGIPLSFNLNHIVPGLFSTICSAMALLRPAPERPTLPPSLNVYRRT